MRSLDHERCPPETAFPPGNCGKFVRACRRGWIQKMKPAMLVLCQVKSARHPVRVDNATCTATATASCTLRSGREAGIVSPELFRLTVFSPVPAEFPWAVVAGKAVAVSLEAASSGGFPAPGRSREPMAHHTLKVWHRHEWTPHERGLVRSVRVETRLYAMRAHPL
jgi:hypothetical protein